jgi:hypothetical protein
MEIPYLGFGAAQGTLRYDPISTNGPKSIAVFPRENTRIGAADKPCHRPTSWIDSPRDFPKWAKPEIFRYVRIGKAGGAPVLSRKCQGQNGKRQFSSECARLIGSYRSSPCVAPTSDARPRNRPSRSRRIHAGGACRLRITDMVVPVLHGLVERKRQSITHLCAELNAAA